jgi:hypothetical protein
MVDTPKKDEGAGRPLVRMADELRALNVERPAPPDLPADRSPPGRTPETMTAEQQELVLLAVEGLAAHLRTQLERVREGSPDYWRLGGMIGSLTTSANQIRRWLAAHDKEGAG